MTHFARQLLRWTAIVLLLAATGTQAWSDPLDIGDKAPPLAVSSWVKGEPVESLAPGSIYVVEFWATWCGPCRVSIPHLTDLQKEFGDKVTVIGVSVLEETPEDVAPFVTEMGDKMAYRVAADKVAEGAETSEGEMATNWLAAAELPGIPSAFIVGKDGRIAWIGHPMEMEEPLAAVVDGTWDLDLAVAEKKKERELETRFKAVAEPVVALLQEDKLDEALAALSKAIEDEPDLATTQLGLLQLTLLLESDNEDQATVVAKQLGVANAEDAQALNFLAWTLIDPEREKAVSGPLLAVATDLAQKADDLTDHAEPAVLDTLARAQFLNGDVKGALATQEKAIELGGADLDASITERRDFYRDQLKEAPEPAAARP